MASDLDGGGPFWYSQTGTFLIFVTCVENSLNSLRWHKLFQVLTPLILQNMNKVESWQPATSV